jgi:hypothetical protein
MSTRTMSPSDSPAERALWPRGGGTKASAVAERRRRAVVGRGVGRVRPVAGEEVALAGVDSEDLVRPEAAQRRLVEVGLAVAARHGARLALARDARGEAVGRRAR